MHSTVDKASYCVLQLLTLTHIILDIYIILTIKLQFYNCKRLFVVHGRFLALTACMFSFSRYRLNTSDDVK